MSLKYKILWVDDDVEAFEDLVPYSHTKLSF